MLRTSGVICLAASLAACGRSSNDNEPVRLETILVDPAPWIGKTVTIDGWLLVCHGNNCRITSVADGKELHERRESLGFARMDAIVRRSVSIGYEAAFDRAAAPLEDKRVLFTAKVLRNPLDQACLDRCDNLVPISIRPFSNN